DGFVERYSTSSGVDGLPGSESVFLICTFWLADNLAMQGKKSEAEELFERVLAISNDVGLLSEEYDPARRTPRRLLRRQAAARRSSPLEPLKQPNEPALGRKWP